MKISFKDILIEGGEKLKKELLEDLRRPRPLVNKFLVSQFRQRRLIIEVNTESAESTTEIYPDDKVNKINYRINLGIDKTGFGILERKFFDSKSFSEETLLEYKLLQQICHCIYNELLLKNNPYIKTLNTFAAKQNLADKRFFTLYGSFNVSLNKDNLEREDIIELITMYLWDINYFNRFLRFLIDPAPEANFSKKQFAVRSLTPTDATIVNELIKNAVNSL